MKDKGRIWKEGRERKKKGGERATCGVFLPFKPQDTPSTLDYKTSAHRVDGLGWILGTGCGAMTGSCFRILAVTGLSHSSQSWWTLITNFNICMGENVQGHTPQSPTP